MPITATFSVNDLLGSLSGKELKSLERGAFDGSEVWFRYMTQADDKVRASHAALHGTLWRADDPNAPTPPLDYNCRCFIEYCAAPDSVAAEILPEADGDLSNRNDAFRHWLDDNVEWKKIAKSAKEFAPVDRLEFIREELLDAGIPSSSARDISFMILSVL